MTVTLVTGLWDLGRQELGEGWARPFSHYLDKLDELLALDCNLIIFGSVALKAQVLTKRADKPTLFIERELSWFKDTEFFSQIQAIRKDPAWFNQAGWLPESTQAKLEYYNPLVMAKPFLLHDAKVLDPFSSDYLFWIDAGLTTTVHPGYFSHDKVIDKLPTVVKNMTFVAFPYDAEHEVHGFTYDKLSELAGTSTKVVARGGFFGGPKAMISEFNAIYYQTLKNTLAQGLMGTEESLFTLMLYQYPQLCNYALIEKNGIVAKFFEDLKYDRVQLLTPSGKVENKEKLQVGLYVITFNSPRQFESLVESINQHEQALLTSPAKILLDNSTDLTTFDEYTRICTKWGFEHIKKDNLGICGGRQWIAEDAETRAFTHYFFFEDDMLMTSSRPATCKNGLNRWVGNFYQKLLKLADKTKVDFIKLSFTEFYGDNKTQWAWYNVPQAVRSTFWPENSQLPQQGLSPTTPPTKFEHLYGEGDLLMATGDIYYCNWPQLVTREGNKKMFLQTKWARPYEQTWMSYIFQETKKGLIKPGLLLLSPIEHTRFEFYGKELRKES